MAAVRHLNKPPIVEALIDFHFVVPDDVSIDAIESLAKSFKTEGAIIARRENVEAQVNFHAEGGVDVARNNTSFACFVVQSKDGTEAIQLRRDGVTVSRVRMYRDWQDIVDIAHRVFDRFVEAVRPTSVHRIATRYINRLLLPTGTLDIDEYFTSGPRIPPGLPSNLMAFEQRAIMQEVDGNCAANIYLASQGWAADSSPFLLDIDVAAIGKFDPTFSAIEESLERVHQLKNNAFFGSLHEKALEPYV